MNKFSLVWLTALTAICQNEYRVLAETFSVEDYLNQLLSVAVPDLNSVNPTILYGTLEVLNQTALFNYQTTKADVFPALAIVDSPVSVAVLNSFSFPVTLGYSEIQAELNLQLFEEQDVTSTTGTVQLHNVQFETLWSFARNTCSDVYKFISAEITSFDHGNAIITLGRVSADVETQMRASLKPSYEADTEKLMTAAFSVLSKYSNIISPNNFIAV